MEKIRGKQKWLSNYIIGNPQKSRISFKAKKQERRYDIKGEQGAIQRFWHKNNCQNKTELLKAKIQIKL